MPGKRGLRYSKSGLNWLLRSKTPNIEGGTPIILSSAILRVFDCKVMMNVITSLSPNLSREFLLSDSFEDIIVNMLICIIKKSLFAW